MWGRTISDIDASFQRLGSTHSEPPTDVLEGPDTVTVTIDVAGLRGRKFEVRLRGDTLIVSGERPAAPQPPDSRCHQLEIWSGPWRRDIRLPGPIDIDRLSTSYRDGFLQLTFPKRQPRGR